MPMAHSLPQLASKLKADSLNDRSLLSLILQVAAGCLLHSIQGRLTGSGILEDVYSQGIQSHSVHLQTHLDHDGVGPKLVSHYQSQEIDLDDLHGEFLSAIL